MSPLKCEALSFYKFTQQVERGMYVRIHCIFIKCSCRVKGVMTYMKTCATLLCDTILYVVYGQTRP